MWSLNVKTSNFLEEILQLQIPSHIIYHSHTRNKRTGNQQTDAELISSVRQWVNPLTEPQQHQHPPLNTQHHFDRITDAWKPSSSLC